MSESLYLCIDAGTTRFKAALVTSGGRLVSQNDTWYRTGADSARIHEYDPDDFLRALRETTGGLAAQACGRLAAVGITGHGPTLLPVDRRGAPLHAAVGYLDDRVGRYVRGLAERESDRITSTMYLPIALFFKEELPSVYRRTHLFMQGFDFLAFRLTGSAAASSSTSGLKPWDAGALERAGLDRKKFPPVRYMGELIGATGPGAAELGIPGGIPVVAVGVDFGAALVGTGSVRRGRGCERAGSSGAVNVCWDSEVRDRRLLCYRHFVKGMWNVAGITSTYGKALDWARGLAGDRGGGLGAPETPHAGGTGRGRLGTVRFPAPVVLLPYLKGERSPVWNPFVRGVLAGPFSGDSGGGEGLLAGAFQGVAFSIRNCIEILEESGCRFHGPLVSTGGSSGDDRFMQMKADVTGKEFALPLVRDAELLGTAGVLAVREGRYPDIASVAETLVRLDRTFKPSNKVKPAYDQLYRLYLDLQGHAAGWADRGSST